jgi:hypothetical protein
MDFNIPAFRHCLPSRCLAMVFHKPFSSDGRLIRLVAAFISEVPSNLSQYVYLFSSMRATGSLIILDLIIAVIYSTSYEAVISIFTVKKQSSDHSDW